MLMTEKKPAPKVNIPVRGAMRKKGTTIRTIPRLKIRLKTTHR